MDFEGVTLSEISKTQKEIYPMISLTCGIKKQNKKFIDTQNRLLVGRAGVRVGKIDETSQKLQTSSNKIDVIGYYIVYLKVTKTTN